MSADTTAPDAIIQADCEAADALENELGFLSVEEMPKVRAAFAAHRRLPAHGAGEGLREALEEFCRAAEYTAGCDSDAGVDPDRASSEIWSSMGSPMAVAYDKACKLLTPLTDAGSTTREGGERVADAPADLLAHLQRIPMTEWVWSDAERIFATLTALATTSSPDASPDSGEATTLAIAVEQNDRMRQDLAHVGNLASDLARAMKVEQANKDGTWPDLAGRIGKLLDAARQNAASPASLSGGAEDRARLIDLIRHSAFWHGTPSNEAAATKIADAFFAPSPEAPANRQEAGEVERLRELLKKERQRATDALYMRDAYRRMLGPKGQQVADAWDAAGLIRVHVSWGPDAALLDGEGIAQAHLDMAEAAKTGTPIEDVDGHIATLTSPKGVKGGGR